MFQVVLDRVSKTGEIRMPTLSSAKLNLLTIVFLVACGSVTFAQHDPRGGPGGGTIGGGSTGRPASKPPKRPATAPRRTTASTSTAKPPIKNTTPGPRDSNADSYYQQGETLYNAEKYREALDFYLKAAQLNPSMGSAWYRI